MLFLLFFLLIISIFSLTYAANVTNSIENGVMDIKAAAEDTGNTVKDMAEDAGEGMKKCYWFSNEYS